MSLNWLSWTKFCTPGFAFYFGDCLSFNSMYSNSSITQHASLIDVTNKPTTYHSIHLLLNYGKRTNKPSKLSHARECRHSSEALISGADSTTPEGAELYK